jgi:hypothetical protein
MSLVEVQEVERVAHVRRVYRRSVIAFGSDPPDNGRILADISADRPDRGAANITAMS